MTVTESEERAVATAVVVFVFLVGGLAVAGATMLCCRRRRKGCEGERGGAELDANNQPWYLQQEQHQPDPVQPRQPLFELAALPKTFQNQPGPGSQNQPGPAQYVEGYVEHQRHMQEQYVHQHQEEEEEEEEEEQFPMEDGMVGEVGKARVGFAGGQIQITIPASAPNKAYHIPRPQSRLMRISTTGEELDDYIKMNPVGPIGCSTTLPLAARGQPPDFSQLAAMDHRLCTSYRETAGMNAEAP